MSLKLFELKFVSKRIEETDECVKFRILKFKFAPSILSTVTIIFLSIVYIKTANLISIH
ncbi:hypothetical protein J2Z40_002864 [Cytobacillus eiseniae]|uniref:Uncharacterized protein n=1 Tax=Cytobacillus eiseniae TaxID=762947 RepID=A0ABS4RHB5_9BACI|nr:hypothetical protein [Cytobacillus eiseniae]